MTNNHEQYTRTRNRININGGGLSTMTDRANLQKLAGVPTPDEINSLNDYIDSRDVEDRIDWLIQENKASREAGESIELREADLAELESLLKLKEQYIDYFGESSWSFGAQFIRDGYFEDYAQELANDIGAMDSDFTWPNDCIDWERAANELKMDYTEIDFDGVVYQTREA